MATTIVGIRIKNSGKLFYFSPAEVWPRRGEKVIVETMRGQVMGDVIIGVRSIEDEMITIPLKPVIRIATQEDIVHQQELDELAVQAFVECKLKIEEHNLDMKLVRVEPMFDDSKIMFYFTANQRIDFRDLVKDLAAVYKRRIELRQIGVRDEAKIIGTLGVCGRKVCCASFLHSFQPVSIKMAKEQTLSLNPTKISGACGRLMCCLKYEQDYYEYMHKLMPKVNKEIDTPDGRGIVSETNVIMETVKVKIEKDDNIEIKTYTLEQINNPDITPKEEEKKSLTEFEQFIANEKAKQNNKPEVTKNRAIARDEQSNSKANNTNTTNKTSSKPPKKRRRLDTAQKNEENTLENVIPAHTTNKPNKLTEEKKQNIQTSWKKAVEKAIQKSKG